ncbi:MAG: hypothetical protein F9K24_03420 [Leptonema illini]|uniref:Lipoprotein n=1 Tax=Leptonema illini TaxID=183 RepID=A0A833LYK9_9LEPT|nr:MAG: hypothetical protein F9K24_03420 [Leptonema illini]
MLKSVLSWIFLIGFLPSLLVGCESTGGLGYDLVRLDDEMKLFYQSEKEGNEEGYRQKINPLIEKRSPAVFADMVARIRYRRSLSGAPDYRCCRFSPIAKQSDLGRLVWIRCIVTRRSSKYWEVYIGSVVSPEKLATKQYENSLYLEQIGTSSREPPWGIPWPEYEGVGECDAF